jgi:hypothetical protein
MSVPKAPLPAKLVVGVIVKDKPLFDELAGELVDQFGDMDLISPWFSFDFTTYYEKEMGENLSRRMIAFSSLVNPVDLPVIKCATNSIEGKYAPSGHRAANLDPGYLVLERFVLATGKNFTHRIYLGKGIYADLTLIYQKGRFHTLPWTYPDYAHADIQGFLNQVREKYKMDLESIS